MGALSVLLVCTKEIFAGPFDELPSLIDEASHPFPDTTTHALAPHSTFSPQAHLVG
jgi:hypothetical protein